MAKGKLQSQPQPEVVNEWMDISLEYFQHAMERKGVRMSKQGLFGSLMGELVTGSEGDIVKAMISFRNYGRFVDMGVGRGIPIGSQSAKANYLKNRKTSGKGRKAKKWYSPTISGRAKTLGELLGDLYGTQAISVLETGLDTDVNIQF